jgi:hypothetical protein
MNTSPAPRCLSSPLEVVSRSAPSYIVKKGSDDGGTHHLSALENIASLVASGVYGSQKNLQQLLSGGRGGGRALRGGRQGDQAPVRGIGKGGRAPRGGWRGG